MRRKYLVGPIVCTFACWTFGNGILPTLPIYAAERGASRTASGVFLAFVFLCLALGTAGTGVLPKDFRNRKWLIAGSGVLIAGLMWLLSRTTTLVAFAVVLGFSWFLAGVVFSQAATLTGLSAGESDRGAAFGILGVTNGTGSLVGGIGIGLLGDRFGFGGVCAGSAALSALVVLGGILCVESPATVVTEAPQVTAAGTGTRRSPIGVSLLLLLVSQFLLAVNNATGSLGRSLAMGVGGFSKSAISLTASIMGFVALSVPFALGWLSDRIGRKGIMVSLYLATTASIVLLAFSRVTWHYYVFAGLFAALSIVFSVGPAYVMDIVPRENVARGVSLYQTMFWAGSILGMAAGGLAFETLGLAPPLLISGALPVAGVVLLLFIRDRRRQLR